MVEPPWRCPQYSLRRHATIVTDGRQGSAHRVQQTTCHSGSGARLELLGQPTVEGFGECRRVRTNVYSKKRKALTRVWTACRDDVDGGWRLVRAN